MDEITKEDDRLSSPAETQAEVEAYYTLPTLFNYRAAGRGGFTLIELLIVLVVVLLLAGLLLGAVIVVRGQVTKAQQVAELTQLDLALAKFKEKHGIFPPSRIRLREWVFTGPGAPSSATTAYDTRDPFDAHSLAYLRRIWPSIRLYVTDGTSIVETPTAPSYGQWFQDNSAGVTFTPRVYELEGDECLVFFLGGVCEKTGQNSYILHGFTDDATNPSRIPDGSNARTQKRIQPFFQFDPGRLYQRDLVSLSFPRQAAPPYNGEFSGSGFVDFFGPGTPLGVPGSLPSYKVPGADQSRPLPIAYFSAYEGRGYRPDDLNIPAGSSSTDRDQSQVIQLLWPQVTVQVGGTPRGSPVSLGPNPYARNGGNPFLRTPQGGRIQCYNPQTYQIILPGADNEFGGGGSQVDYNTDVTAANSPTNNWTSNEDNLTNFSGGAPLGQFVTQQNQQ